MTVRELIELLKKKDPDRTVVMDSDLPLENIFGVDLMWVHLEDFALRGLDDPPSLHEDWNVCVVIS